MKGGHAPLLGFNAAGELTMTSWGAEQTIEPIATPESEFQPPAGTKSGRILVEVLGCPGEGYRWDTEVLDHDGDSAVFWISEGIGFDYFFNDVDFPGPGFWVITDITVHWTRGDGWEIDDDEDHEWGEIRPATIEEAHTGHLS